MKHNTFLDTVLAIIHEHDEPKAETPVERPIATTDQIVAVENDALEALHMAEQMLRDIGNGRGYDKGDFWTRVCAIQTNLRLNGKL